jgi:hypothetical protein
MDELVRTKIADFLGGKGEPPLWTLLPNERALRPTGLDENVGLDAAALRQLLDAGNASTLLNTTVGFIQGDQLTPLGREGSSSPPVHIESAPQFLPQAVTFFGSDGAGILFSQGLDILLLALAIPIASLFVERGSDSVSIGPEVAGDLIAYQLGWLTSLAERPHGKPVFPDARQRMTALDLYVAAKRFILLHELAHILLHSGSPRPLVGMPAWTTNGEAVEWNEELECDEIGLELALAASGGTEIDGRAIWSGIALFFKAQELVESFAGTTDSGSHPPPVRRITSLENSPVLRSEWPIWVWYAQLQRALCDVASHVLIQSPATVEADGRTRAERYRAMFESLVEDAAAVPVPDHAAFVDAAEDLLAACPPSVLAAAQAILTQVRTQLRANTNETSAARRKEQLLVSFASTLPDDVQLKLGVNRAT